METIGSLAKRRKAIKAQIKKLEKETEEVDSKLMELLETEGGERYKLTPKESVAIVRGSQKVWDMDKVYLFIGDKRKVKIVNKETGEIKKLDLLKPNDAALKALALEELRGDDYDRCYYTKLIKPFIKIGKI